MDREATKARARMIPRAPSEVTTKAGSEWIWAIEACRRLGISRSILNKVAESGQVRRRVLPGCRPAFHAGDVARVASEAVRLGDEVYGLGPDGRASAESNAGRGGVAGKVVTP